MIRLKTAILLGTLLFFGSEELQAAAIPGVPAAATPAVHPEPLVQGGLLGAISSSIDDIQSKLNLDRDLLDAWRLRADRARPMRWINWSIAHRRVRAGAWRGISCC